MPRFHVQIDHDREPHVIADRLKQFADSLRHRVPAEVTDVREEWDEFGNLIFSFKAFGFAVKGQLENRDRTVLVTGTLPIVALPFRGRIEQEIVDRIREAID